MSVGIGVVAAGPEFLPAELAISAGDREGHDNAVTAPRLVTSLTDLFHDTHEFVAENVAFFHGGNEAVIEVQIRATDRGTGYFYDCVVRVKDSGSLNMCTSTLPVPIQHSAFIANSHFDYAAASGGALRFVPAASQSFRRKRRFQPGDCAARAMWLAQTRGISPVSAKALK